MSIAFALLLAAADPPTIYQRIQQRFAADPAAAAALGRPAPQMRQADWLIGTWDVSGMVEERGGPPWSGTSVIAPALGGHWLEIRDTYPDGSENIAYVGYSVPEGRWVDVAIDNVMNANRISAPAWTGDRIVFEGDFLIFGMPAHMRQTVARTAPDYFSVVAEELVGGTWRRTAARYYHRRPAH